ncbi:MAG: hypothetical protein KDA84_03735 [Planctomycetaceae bacterium]|nr:hypothetical protein [Planctomycetaceae bacterium]
MSFVMHVRFSKWFLLSGFVCGMVLGCGSPNDGPKRYHISGKVTYDGKPIPKGKIYFEPDDSKGNSGPQAGADIVDGEYETANGKGVVGGPHLVKITGTDGVETQVEGEVLPDGKTLFPPYETTFNFPKEDGEHSFKVPKTTGQ